MGTRFLLVLALGLGGCGFLEDTFAGITVQVQAPAWVTTTAYQVRQQDGGLYASGEVPLVDGRAVLRLSLPAGGSVVLVGRREGEDYYRAELNSPVPGRSYRVAFDPSNRLTLQTQLQPLGLEGITGAQVVVCSPAPTGWNSWTAPACGEGWEAVYQGSGGSITLPKAPRYRTLAVANGQVIAASLLQPPASGTWTVNLTPTQASLAVNGPTWLTGGAYELRDALSGAVAASGSFSFTRGRAQIGLYALAGHNLRVYGYVGNYLFYQVELPPLTGGEQRVVLDESSRRTVQPVVSVLRRPGGVSGTLAICTAEPVGWPVLQESGLCPNGFVPLAKLPFPPDSFSPRLPWMPAYLLRFLLSDGTVREVEWTEPDQPAWLIPFPGP